MTAVPPSEDLSWPDSYVAWHGIIDAAPGYSVPFRTHVFIFHTLDQLRATVGNPDANGYSSTYDEPDADNIGALIILIKTDLELSIVAHEATHIALFHHGKQVQGRAGARRWLGEHPETVAEMIGNLTSLIWYGIPEAENIREAS